MNSDFDRIFQIFSDKFNRTYSNITGKQKKEIAYLSPTVYGLSLIHILIRSKAQKSVLSSDCSLQLDYMKLESLVIADQHAAVNTFPGLVHTARHTMGVGSTRSL